MNDKLATITKTFGLSEAIALPIIDAFLPHYDAALAIAEEAKAVLVTDATQVSEIRRAKELRLKMKDARCAADAVRKHEKENYLRVGNAIQGIYNRVLAIAEPVEARLREAEEFAERAEAARLKKLGEARTKELEPYGVLQDTFNVETYSRMTEEQYQATLAGYRQQHQQKLAEEAQAAKEKREQEAARIAEDRRRSMEAARLRREADAARKTAEEERRAREKVEAELAAKQEEERTAKEQARRKAEAELNAQRDKDAAEAEALRRAANAPDREKLQAYAEALAKVGHPTMSSEDGKLAFGNVRTNVAEMVAWIHERAKGL